MTNTNFYKTRDFSGLEIAICMEDTKDEEKGKFFIPVLTPFLNNDTPYDKIDPKYSSSNIISGDRNMNLKPCTTSNYIDLYLPDGIRDIKKDDKFVISFVGGDINKPYIIGRYR